MGVDRSRGMSDRFLTPSRNAPGNVLAIRKGERGASAPCPRDGPQKRPRWQFQQGATPPLAFNVLKKAPVGNPTGGGHSPLAVVSTLRRRIPCPARLRRAFQFLRRSASLPDPSPHCSCPKRHAWLYRLVAYIPYRSVYEGFRTVAGRDWVAIDAVSVEKGVVGAGVSAHRAHRGAALRISGLRRDLRPGDRRGGRGDEADAFITTSAARKGSPTRSSTCPLRRWPKRSGPSPTGRSARGDPGRAFRGALRLLAARSRTGRGSTMRYASARSRRALPET